MRMKLVGLLLCFITLPSFATASAADIVVRADDGKIVTLEKPASRIISLAPHLTELIFAAGGGDRIVGVIKHSDFPEAAKSIPQVGDSRELDLERIITLKPDLFVVWSQGSSIKQIEQLQRLGVPLFFSDAHKLTDIPKNIQRLGQLMGTEKYANQSAVELFDQLAALSKQYKKSSPVRLFFQVWDSPLYTLNGQQIVSDAIRLCGGVNIFENQKLTAPSVSIESVLQNNPEAIVVASGGTSDESGLGMWRSYSSMLAVKRNNIFQLNSTLITRAGPRMLLGTADLCEKLDQARRKRQ